MRYFEITSGVRIPISEEEQAILDMADKPLMRETLDERQQEVARLMVSRGLLRRIRDDDKKIMFVKNKKKLSRD